MVEPIEGQRIHLTSRVQDHDREGGGCSQVLIQVARAMIPQRQAREERAIARLYLHRESSDFLRRQPLSHGVPEGIQHGTNIRGARPISPSTWQRGVQVKAPT